MLKLQSELSRGQTAQQHEIKPKEKQELEINGLNGTEQTVFYSLLDLEVQVLFKKYKFQP